MAPSQWSGGTYPVAVDDPQPDVAAPAVAATLSASGEMEFPITTTSGFSYQLQAKATLFEPAWANLGFALTATSSTLAFSDTINGRSRRFSRVLPTP